MTTLSKLKNNKDLSHLTRIEEEYFRFLWHCDYWDGVRSGVLLYQNRKYWFQILDEGYEEDRRRFAVIELSESQLHEEEYWHELFKEKVGTHTDYDESGQRALGALKPRDLWPEFYDLYKTQEPRDFSDNLVIRWFEI